MLNLIKKLGTLGTTKSWGLFECSFCLEIKKIRSDVAKKQIHCGCQTKEIISKNSFNNWNKKEYRAKQKEAHKKIWDSKEFKKSQSVKSKSVWDSLPEEEKEKRKNILKNLWENEEYKEKQSENKKEYFKNNIEARKILSEKIKLLWQNEEYRNKVIKSYSDRSGVLSSNWQGGISFEPYGIEFNKPLKQFIKNRDFNVCQTPSCKNEKNYRLEIHHIDYDKKNNNPENLITLCLICHRKTGFNREYFTEFYQNIMMGKLMECLL